MPATTAPPDPTSTPTPTDAATGLAAARHSAVVVDLTSCAVIEARGPDAEAFLQGQLSNDVRALAVGANQYTSYNSPKGRMLANFVLWPLGADCFRALVPADIAPALVKGLSVHVLRSKVTITDVSASIVRLGVGGPAGAAVISSAFGAVPEKFGVATADEVTVLGLPGPRYVVFGEGAAASELPARLARHAPAATLAVWRWLTIDAGIPVITAATQDLFVAQMANWDVLGGVNFQKGCYPGQEIVARTRYLGRLKERTYAFHAAVADVGPSARLFSAVFGDQPCGTVVNAAPAPEGGVDLLAVAQIAAVLSGDVRLDGPDGVRLLQRALPYAMPAPPEPVKR